MKKLMSILIFVTASSAFAEIINCPTSDNYSVNGRPWELSLEKPDCDPEEAPYCNRTINVFFKYNFATKKIEEYYGAEVKTISLNTTDNKVTQNEKGITLQCTGTYSSSEKYPGTFWGYWNTNASGRFKAEVLINATDYKNCIAVADNKSFDCSK